MSMDGYPNGKPYDDTGEYEGDIYRDANKSEKMKYKQQQQSYRENIRKYDGRSKEEIARLEREEKRGRDLW